MKYLINKSHKQIRMNKSITSLGSFDPKYYLYLEGVSRDDWLKDMITYGGCNIKPQELSGEFRVKETQLCEGELIKIEAFYNMKSRCAFMFTCVESQTIPR